MNNTPSKERKNMGTTIIFGIIVVAIIVFMQIQKGKGVASISVDAAQELIKDKEVTILDVRTQQEYDSGHLKGAKLISVTELAGRISELDSLKEKKILVYCHSGNRSLAASQILIKRGFTGITNMQGGVGAWSGKGYALVRN